MRNEWYGDERDLVKWQSLLYIARREGIERVCQIAMCIDAGPRNLVIRHLDGETVECQDVREQVNDHFHRHNNLEQTRSLGQVFGIDIHVRLDPFTHATRRQYFEDVLQEIEDSTLRTVWFFDPDTGIEPEHGAPNEKHVKLSELAAAFESLPTGHYLACYRHSWRAPEWQNNARARLAKKLKKCINELEVFTSNDALDVIILAVKKT